MIDMRVKSEKTERKYNLPNAAYGSEMNQIDETSL